MKQTRNIRIMVNQRLSLLKHVELLQAQSHYLHNVMRCMPDDVIKCFNDRDGEFDCRIVSLDKNKVVIEPQKHTRSAAAETDIWLVFAPLKKDKTDFVVEKSVEFGVSRIIPVITEHTNVKNVKIERYISQAIEASEQCGRLSVPTIDKAQNLKEILSSWDKNRILYFMDERRHGANVSEIFKQNSAKLSAILIGPEGGFSDEEAKFLNAQPYVCNVNLGPRILRAETAVAAALAVWQAIAGDWQNTKEINHENINS